MIQRNALLLILNYQSIEHDTIRVAINGYGRIGRNILRAHYEAAKPMTSNRRHQRSRQR